MQTAILREMHMRKRCSAQPESRYNPHLDEPAHKRDRELVRMDTSKDRLDYFSTHASQQTIPRQTGGQKEGFRTGTTSLQGYQLPKTDDQR